MIRYAGPVNDEMSNPRWVQQEQADRLITESERAVARVVVMAMAGADAVKVLNMLGIPDE